MSGIEEILPWALRGFNPEDYPTYDDWLDAVNEAFENDGRLPLKEILKDETDAFKAGYENLKNTSTNEDIQTFLDKFYEKKESENET